MKQPDARPSMPSAGTLASPGGAGAIRIVCAALILASLAVLFRIASIL